MTRRRSEDFDLREAARVASFTPRDSDIPGLLDLAAGDEEAERDVARALARVPTPAATALRERLAAGARDDAGARARLARQLGRLALERRELLADVIALTNDPEERVRRAAVQALGRMPGAESEAALLGALDRATGAPEKNAIVEALGKAGGDAALAAMRGREGVDARVLERARLTLERTLGRTVATARIKADTLVPPGTAIHLHCRKGLAPLLLGEIPAAWKPRLVDAATVAATIDGPLAAVFLARTMLRFGFPLAPVSPGKQRSPRGPVEPDLAAAIAGAIAADAPYRLLRALTDGPIRYRIAWVGGGHKRAVVWRVASLAAARRPDLINDPTDTLWEVAVDARGGGLRIELTPRLADPRFAYRRGDDAATRDVPAASHPTIAAALARVAGARPDDVVWDPFCGSGTELIERALLGPSGALLGTDRSQDALAAARVNLAAAGVTADLRVADATTHRPSGVTLIITNPPMGRRVLDRGQIGTLYDRFLDHAADVLRPGGRLVWISPLPSRTAARAVHAGLRTTREIDVDMGGFTAKLQAFAKPS